MTNGDEAATGHEHAPYLRQSLLDSAVLETKLRRHQLERIGLEGLTLAGYATVEFDGLARPLRRFIADQVGVYVSKVSRRDEEIFAIVLSNFGGNSGYRAVAGSNVEYAGTVR